MTAYPKAESIVNDQPIISNTDSATGGKLPNACKSHIKTTRPQGSTDVVPANTATTLSYSRARQANRPKLRDNMVVKRNWRNTGINSFNHSVPKHLSPHRSE